MWKSSEPPPAIPATNLQRIWTELNTTIKRMKDLKQAEIDSEKAQHGLLRVKEEELSAAVRNLNEQKSALQQDYDKSVSDGIVDVGDAGYTARLATVDAALTRMTSELDQVRLDMYFPQSKYPYRMASNGMYIGMHDFWLASVVAGLQVQLVPGMGEVEQLATHARGTSATPPGVLVDLKPVSISLLINQLGLQGESVPSALKSLDRVELNVELEAQVRLQFAPPKSIAKGKSKHAAASTSTSTSPKDALLGFEWRVLDSTKFEVTRLDAKGIASAVPNSVIRLLINSMASSRIEAAVLDLIPKEFGLLLSLYMDHRIEFDGQFCLSSFPLNYLQVSLQAAPTDAEVPSLNNLEAGFSRKLRGSLLRKTASAIRSSLKTRAPSELPASWAHEAAQAIGLTTLQARSLVQAQKDAMGHRGTAVFSSLWDLMTFTAEFCPDGRPSVQSHAMADAQNELWSQFIASFQSLIAEHNQYALADACTKASSIAADEARKAATKEAQLHAAASYIQISELFLAVKELCAKPVVVNLSVNKLLVRGHVESTLGVWQAMQLRHLSSSFAEAVPQSTMSKPDEAQPRSSSRYSWLGFGGSKTAGSEKIKPQGSTNVVLNPASGIHYKRLLEDLQKWASRQRSSMRTLHSLITRLTASIGAGIDGGERGQVSACVRQLQLEMAPGFTFPSTMTEGFWPPKPVVSIMESRDETSPALAAANPSFIGDSGRGTFSMMLAWPKVDDPIGVTDAVVEALATSDTELNFTAASAFDALDIGPGDVDVLATVRLHRFWMGLRIDEAALLKMVQDRARAQKEGTLGHSKHLPPLYALEMGLRPAVFGNSYDTSGIDQDEARALASQRPDFRGKALSGAPQRVPAFPYVLGVETPSWTRLAMELSALEVFGDLPLLVKQSRHLITSIWRGASIGSDTDGDVEDDETASPVAADTQPTTPISPPAILPVALVPEGSIAVDGMRRSASFSSTHSNRSRALSTASGAGGKGRMDHGFISSLASRTSQLLSKYLKNEQLHLSLNLAVSVLVMPSAPVVEEGMAETLHHVAGSQFEQKSGEVSSRMSVAISSSHGLQPSMVPPAGSATYTIGSKRSPAEPGPTTKAATVTAPVPSAPVPVAVSTASADDAGKAGTAPLPSAHKSALVLDMQLPLMQMIRDMKMLRNVLNPNELADQIDS